MYKKRKSRFRFLLSLLLCFMLFYCGLAVVDKSFKDMVDKDDGRPIFGVYDLSEPVIKLEFAGSEVLIDKAEWEKAYGLVRQRVTQILRIR